MGEASDKSKGAPAREPGVMTTPEMREWVRRLVDAHGRPPDAGSPERELFAIAGSLRTIGEAHEAMITTLARMAETGERLADHEAGLLLDLSEDASGALWAMQRSVRAWRSAVRSEHTRAALAKAQGGGDE